MEREQIVKALECCAVNEICHGCPCHPKFYKGGCVSIVMKDALALINELTAKNEWFEELRERDKHFMDIYLEASGAKKVIADTKADTVRKMQLEIKSRCIEGGIYPAFVERTVDQIAKEMLKEGEGK